MTTPRWLKRPYAPGPQGDEDAVVYLWLKSFAHSRYGTKLGAHIDASPEERAYWREHQPIVMALISEADVTIACDPEAPQVVWGFACTSADAVHFAVIKRRFAEIRRAMLLDMLGGHLARPVRYTHEMPDLRTARIEIPPGWVYDPYVLVAQLGPRRAA